uniref:Septin 12 n=1 Tax=Accipiter nisus TaxID=211598 RepID=A0A8B9N3Z1_9AVES
VGLPQGCHLPGPPPPGGGRRVPLPCRASPAARNAPGLYPNLWDAPKWIRSCYRPGGISLSGGTGRQTGPAGDPTGQSGLGKSTMVNTLFKSKVSRKASQPGQEERIPKTVQVQSISHVIEEKGVKMKLTVTDTPGFGDQINNENCWDPIIKYINEQYERYLREEVLITRKRKIPDTRVHGCVYFVPPTGHWLRPLDLEFMQRLSKIVNVVPVIAKADTLTLEERAEFKQRIQEDLKTHAISVYPQADFDQDPDDRLLNDRIREKIPFAVVGADQEHQVNGKRVLGRKTKWGIIEVENPAHCEFPLLRDLLIRSHLQDLKDITHNVHYESYRVRRLNESNRPALSPLNGLPGKGEGSSNL